MFYCCPQCGKEEKNVLFQTGPNGKSICRRCFAEEVEIAESVDSAEYIERQRERHQRHIEW